MSEITPSYPFEDLGITPVKKGFTEHVKLSCPVRYGVYGEIKTRDYLYHFNLRGEIRQIQGRARSWPNPAEWLKRSDGGDWIYYSSGGYRGVYELFGEHYFPCLSYESNSIAPDNPFELASVRGASLSLRPLLEKLKRAVSEIDSATVRRFLTGIVSADSTTLRMRANRLHRIIGARLSVIPPDLRHADYDAIPLIVADGCLYRCGFCRVKNGMDFVPRTFENILDQIKGLKAHFGEDLPNYNALFLGTLDALNAGKSAIEFAATEAYERFDFERSYIKCPKLFFFASVDSLLRAPPGLFELLNDLPYTSYINIGLESADAATFDRLKKPLSVDRVYEAYRKMIEINRRFARVEVTANFVLGESLSQNHDASVLALIGATPGWVKDKGCLYFSPLLDAERGDNRAKQAVISRFREIKRHIRIPAHLYLIQRL
ncbi:MAG: hypothetical protein JXA30_12755 [Deltaproteobacteria bacterium]|nr:hypothetical protein [Deltaproteobacteria bacterium]